MIQFADSCLYVPTAKGPYRQYILDQVFHSLQYIQHPSEMGNIEVELFLTFLAVDRNVSPATQRIALNALSFLYNKFLDKPLGDVSAFKRSSKQQKLPVVLTRPEMASLLSFLSGYQLLIASIIYGSGLRRIEAIRLKW